MIGVESGARFDGVISVSVPQNQPRLTRHARDAYPAFCGCLDLHLISGRETPGVLFQRCASRPHRGGASGPNPEGKTIDNRLHGALAPTDMTGPYRLAVAPTLTTQGFA